jgi:transposase-like protein
MPRRIPDHLIAIQDAAAENGISVETLYRWLRPLQEKERGRPELHRHRVPGDRRTFLDRRELEEALRPRAG